MSQRRIVTVASHKGGVGKTTIAYELAQLANAVLVDFEWDGGGVSSTWGYDPETRATDPLFAAIERDRTPRVLKGHGMKPDLVPGSPDLPDLDLDAVELGRLVARWADEWGRPVVVDTHPGSSPAAIGAMSVSHAVCVPVPLATKELAGTARMIRQMADYPLILVPNLVGRFAPAAEVRKLEKMIEGTRIEIGPIIPDGKRAVSTRKKRMAMTAERPPAKAITPIVTALQDLDRFLQEYSNE